MASTQTLGELRTKEGDTLLHLLCAGTLRDRKQEFKKNVPKSVYANIKESTNALKLDDVATAVAVLLEGGCDVNAQNEAGDTPLDILCNTTYEEVQLREERGKKLCLSCEITSLTVLGALLDANADVTDLLIKRNLHISLIILSHNQNLQGKSWSLSPLEMARTPLRFFAGRSKQLHTDVCRLMTDKLNRHPTHLQPELILRVMGVFLDTIHNDVNRGEVLVNLLQNIGIRFDNDQSFADEILFGEAVFLPFLDQVITALAGAKGCDAMSYRCPATGTTPFHLAVVLGLQETVGFFLQHPRVCVNVLDDMGNNPLMVALNIMRSSRVWATSRLSVYLHIAKLIASDSNQNFDLEDKFGSTSLLYCLEAMSAQGSHYREQRLFSEILHDPSGRRGSQAVAVKGMTAAMLCVVEGLPAALHQLIRSRHPAPDLSATDPRGRTVLHLAAIYGRKECAELLIDVMPALCKIGDNRGQTPLFYIVENFEAEDAMQMMSRNVNLWQFNRRNIVNQSALDYYKEQIPKMKRDKDLEKSLSNFAAAAQFHRSFSRSLESFDSVSNTSKSDTLRKSFARMFRVERAERAVRGEGGASSAPNDRRRNMSGPDEQLQKPLKQHVDDTALLRQIFETIAVKTTPINAPNINTGTAAMICAANGLADELSFILHRLPVSPDLNIQDGRGMTALHMAADSGKVDCVLALLAAPGIDINIQDKLGNSALFYIVVKLTPNEAAKILTSNPWNFDLRNNFDQTASEYYVTKLTQRDLNEELANVLGRRCAAPLPSVVSDRSRKVSTSSCRLSLPHSYSAGSCLNAAGSELDLANQGWRLVLKKYRIFFLENFDSHPVFFSYIMQEDVIDQYTMDKIQAIGTSEDMATEIIRLFSKKGESAFRVLLDALRKSSQGHIAETLENALDEALDGEIAY